MEHKQLCISYFWILFDLYTNTKMYKNVIWKCKTGVQVAAEHKMILFLLVKPDQLKNQTAYTVKCLVLSGYC